jgi:hypothetical protein
MLVAFLLSVPAAAAAAPVNDDVANVRNLPLNTPDTISTVGATTEPGEPFTYPVGFWTVRTGFEHYVGATAWYRVAGTGNPITLSTAGSTTSGGGRLDTFLVRYNSGTSLDTAGALCSDDVGGSDVSSTITFDSVAGRAYLVQVGGAQYRAAGTPDPLEPPTPRTGTVHLLAQGTPGPTTPPDNTPRREAPDRAHAP